MEQRKVIDAKRRKDESKEEEDKEEKGEIAVSAGAVDRVIDLAFNASREKIREVTVIDRIQGRLFPLLDVINLGRQYILEIALYRQDKEEYKKVFKQPRPVSPNLLDELLFRTAQWQKSVAGKNLERAIDIALAETENKAGEEDSSYGGRDPWGDR